MTQESLPLNCQVIDGLFHARDALLSAPNQILICNNFVDQLILAHAVDFLLSVSHIVLPLVEPALEWVVHRVDDEASGLLHAFALLDELSPAIEGFGNNVELTVLEEEGDYRLVHVRFLLLSPFLNELLNGLRVVT